MFEALSEIDGRYGKIEGTPLEKHIHIDAL
jgi:hypothetical protein